MKKLCVLVVLFSLCGWVVADSIAVTNYSFEQPGAGKIKGWNGENGTEIPGWASDTAAVDSGVESDWPGSTDGVYSGYMMSGDPFTYNLTDHIIAAGEVFTLQVDARDNWTPSGNTYKFLLSLYYDNAGARVLAASTTVDLTTTWTTFSLSFAANDVAASIGKGIGIELDNVSTPTGSNSWQGMDNVRLDVVPEPATLSLLGLGVLAMLRKRK